MFFCRREALLTFKEIHIIQYVKNVSLEVFIFAIFFASCPSLLIILNYETV